MPGAFAAFAVAPHYIDDSRFFSALPFSDPKMIMSATAVFAGVPVGSTTLLPVGKYVPDVAVANFLGKDVYVTIGYARSSGSNSMVQQIASVTVPATSTRELTLENLEGDPDLKDSFLISSDAPPGAVITKLVAKSGSRLREVELLGKDEKEQTTGGGHPWSVEEGHESTLLLFNHSNDSQYFNVLISSGRDLWQKAYKL